MRIRYVGPLGGGIDVDLPDGRTVTVAQGELKTFDDDVARGLLEQGEEHWQLESHFGSQGEIEPLSGVRPGKLCAMTLRRQRKLRDWSQTELLGRLANGGRQRSQAALSRLESGEQGMLVDDLVELAYALNVSPLRLLEGAFLAEPQNVKVTDEVTVSPSRYRSWLRGGRPLPADKEWRKFSEESWSSAHYRAVSDEDWLNLQRTTVSMLVSECRALVKVADRYREHVPDEAQAAFDEARGKVGDQVDALDRSQSDFPSERSTRKERRERPRVSK